MQRGTGKLAVAVEPHPWIQTDILPNVVDYNAFMPTSLIGFPLSMEEEKPNVIQKLTGNSHDRVEP